MAELVGGISIMVVGLIVIGASVASLRKVDRNDTRQRSRFEISPLAQAYMQFAGGAILLVVGIVFTIVGLAKG